MLVSSCSDSDLDMWTEEKSERTGDSAGSLIAQGCSGSDISSDSCFEVLLVLQDLCFDTFQSLGSSYGFKRGEYESV